MTRFTDGDNEITINPHKQEIQAVFMSGENLTLRIPSNYRVYSVKFDGAALVKVEDVDNILQWKNATTMNLLDNNDLAFDLMQRIEEMREIQYLEQLELSIPRTLYSNFEIQLFLYKLPTLKKVTLKATHLTDDEYVEFFDKQICLGGWSRISTYHKIIYEKLPEFKPTFKDIIEVLKAALFGA